MLLGIFFILSVTEEAVVMAKQVWDGVNIFWYIFHDLLIPAIMVGLGGSMWVVSNQGTSETHFFGLKSSVNLTPDCQNHIARYFWYQRT